MQPNKKVKIIGHRGAKGYEPENTLCSFEKAIELNVDVIEFDVRSLPSGEVVIMHDFVINRTTNGRGRTKNISFKDLRKLDAGKGEKIPTLHEAMDLINHRASVYIELKGGDVAYRVAQILRKYISAGWSEKNILVASFNLEELRIFHKLMPHVQVVSLYRRGIGKYFGISGKIEKIHIWRRFSTAALIKKARYKNEQFIIGTSNRQSHIQKLAELGVDAIVTNYPDRVHKALSVSRL